MICAGITKAGNIITVDYVAGDAGHGNSWGNEYRLMDIIDTAAENEWPGCSVQEGTDFSHFFIPYAVYIQGADTYFLIQEEGLMIETTESYALYVNGVNFKLTSGVEDADSIITSNHKYIRFADSSVTIEYALLNKNYRIWFYSTTISISKTVICGTQIPFIYAGSWSDVVIHNCYYGFAIYGSFTSAERIKIQNCIYGIALNGESGNASNVECVNCNNDIRLNPITTGNCKFNKL